MKDWFYLFTRFLFRVYLKLNHGLKVINEGTVPASGGMIIASNHVSYLDPPLVGVSIYNRQLYYMARASLFRNPVFGAIIHWLHSVPIERGKGPDQDWDSFLRVVNRGDALLVFPEGTRSENGELQRGKSGFGRLVHMAQKPVYPVYVHGSYEAFPKHGKRKRVPITVVLGPPVVLNDLLEQPGTEKRILREISDRTMKAIAELKASLGPDEIKRK
jgi:1-acyl-sn-glycerol-3-phosphate acyltransferase